MYSFHFIYETSLSLILFIDIVVTYCKFIITLYFVNNCDINVNKLFNTVYFS